MNDIERLLRAGCGDDAVAAGFEQEGADGEDLFVVVDAEDRLLGAHAVSLLPDAAVVAGRGRWARAEVPAGLQALRSGVFERSPWSGRIALGA